MAAGNFSHLLYVPAVAPTGRWQPGFSPITALERPGIDTGWAVTRERKLCARVKACRSVPVRSGKGLDAPHRSWGGAPTVAGAIYLS